MLTKHSLESGAIMKIDNIDRRENLFVVDGEIVEGGEGGATICKLKANITLLPSILSEAKCAAMNIIMVNQTDFFIFY